MQIEAYNIDLVTIVSKDNCSFLKTHIQIISVVIRTCLVMAVTMSVLLVYP